MSENDYGLSGQLSIAVPPGEEAFWLSLSFIPASIAVYTADCDPSGNLVLLDCGDASRKKEPLFFALICVDVRHLADLKSLKANPAVWRHFTQANALCVGETNPSKILQAVIAELAKYTGRLAHFSTDQALALSSMRRDYENLHLRFSALESYIQRAGKRLVRERMFIAPALTRDGDQLLVEAPHGRSAQVLPIGSKGLCAVDVFVKFVGANPIGGSLQVSLFLGDGKEPVTTWSITPDHQFADDGGWHSLALACAIEGINKTASLQLDLQGLEPHNIQIGVSKLNPNPAYCWSSVDTGKPVVDRPLALRIWEAPPGLRVPHVPNIILGPARAAPPEGGRRLPGHALRQCRPMHDGWEPGFAAVEYLPDDDAICVYPPDKGVCVGVLDRVVPPAAISVSATAFLANENAAPVEFALAVLETLDHDEGATSWVEFPLLQEPLAWSGWRGVECLCHHQLTLILPAGPSPRSKPLSMALLTRMEGGRGNAFAWARFTDVRIEEIV